ncbi:MAG: hypothetical protein GXO78_14405 [Calditrichaeota bacterium]|nr:hypothetical protein [Calditrichota bacterium]
MSRLGLVVFLLMMFLQLTMGQETVTPRVGAGIIIGEPTGISLKYWQSSSQAFAAAAAWSFRGKAAVHVHVDYLFHHSVTQEIRQGNLASYFGLGVRSKFRDGILLGVRIPVGINYLFAGAPLEFFIEFVPIMELIPATELKINGGFGLRYYF